MHEKLVRLSGVVRRLLTIDARALAALRIAMAAFLLLDLAIRGTALIAHYTDVGVLPRPARVTSYEYGSETSARYWWSLHMANGTGWFQLLLFLVAAWFAVWLLLGYRTRLATVVSWVLLVSLHTRLPAVVQGGDVLLRMMLFWSMFVPLGAAWSIDRARHGQGSLSPTQVFSLGTICMLLQPAIMYWFAALAKNDPMWNRNYTAVYYALELDLYAKPLGIALRSYPQVLKLLTFATYWLEWMGPAIAFLPWRTGFWRLLMAAVFWSFHLGLAFTLHLGFFSYVAMAAWLVFLPSGFWDRIERWTTGLRSGFPRLRPERFSALGERLFSRPAMPYFAPSKPGTATLAAILAGVLWSNGLAMRSIDGPVGGPAWLHNAVAALRLEQHWFLFAPRPARDDGWCLMRGVLVDGSEVNLWRPDDPLPWTKPPLVAAQFPNHRWRKLIASLCWESDQEELSCFSDWLAWRWNSFYSGGSPDRAVQLVEIVFYRERTPPPGEAPLPVEPLLLWNWDYVKGAPPEDVPVDAPDLPGAESLP